MIRFDAKALYAALDTQRTARGLTWKQVSVEIGVAAATITRTKDGGRLEVDGMLAMVRWLGEPVETFTRGETRPAVGVAAPCFVVRDVPKALAFYRDKLGFEITFEGPPGDIFFGIVERGRAMIMMKAVGVEPVPNGTRDIKKGILPWDAYIYVPDPDALAAEFLSRGVEFRTPLGNNDDDLRGFEAYDADRYVIYFGRPNQK